MTMLRTPKEILTYITHHGIAGLERYFLNNNIPFTNEVTAESFDITVYNEFDEKLYEIHSDICTDELTLTVETGQFNFERYVFKRGVVTKYSTVTDNIPNKLYTYIAHVTDVVDGDTIKVRLSLGFDTYADRTVRLLNIDTPERNKPGYHEAKELTSQLVLGKDIYIQTYKHDSFARYLANVYYKKDGMILDLSEQLKANGLIKEGSKWNKKEDGRWNQ